MSKAVKEVMDEGIDLAVSEDEDDVTVTDDDYGFVLGPDGELKSIILPAEYFEIPERILEIFKLLGIQSPDDVRLHSVH